MKRVSLKNFFKQFPPQAIKGNSYTTPNMIQKKVKLNVANSIFEMNSYFTIEEEKEILWDIKVVNYKRSPFSNLLKEKDVLLKKAIESTIEYWFKGNSAHKKPLFVNHSLYKLSKFINDNSYFLTENHKQVSIDTLSIFIELIQTIPYTLSYKKTNQIIEEITNALFQEKIQNNDSNKDIPINFCNNLNKRSEQLIQFINYLQSMRSLIYLLLSSENKQIISLIEGAISNDRDKTKTILSGCIDNYCIKPDFSQFKKDLGTKLTPINLQAGSLYRYKTNANMTGS